MALSFFFFFPFLLLRFYLIRVFCRILIIPPLSLISLGFLVHDFLSRSRLSLLSLVHTQGTPDSFALLALLGVHVSALLLSFSSFFPLFSHSLGTSFVLFSSFLFPLVSSLTSLRSFLCFAFVFFLSVMFTCYGTSPSPLSVSASLLSLCFFLLRSTTVHCNYHGSMILT
jgi:hypothetical protein